MAHGTDRAVGDPSPAGFDAAPPRGLDAALARALAEELVAITTQLSDLAFDLASDADTLRRHMRELQAVDRITQAQLAVADILRSTAPEEDRLAAVTLEEVATSLRQRWAHHKGE